MPISMLGVYRYDLDLMVLKLTNQMARHMILIDICIFYLSRAGKVEKKSIIRERIKATYGFNINYATPQYKGSEDCKM